MTKKKPIKPNKPVRRPKAKPKKPRAAKTRLKAARTGGFARARVEKQIRNAGAFRVSAAATYRLNELLTEYATGVAKYAVEIARHSGRKTVKESDIKLASTK